ncbi:MAG TPA: hypothetical protein VFE05_15650 [Longimicrobiaceae bacterium]|jgi:putative sterol carrier protein|nr:hypothetical protein [Longimicrobiaceae bacterium]
MEVFTEEWSRACCRALNGHAGFKAAAGDWEDSVALVMRADPSHGVTQDRAFHLDLFHGVCRGVRPASPGDLESAAYVMEADVAAWREILQGRSDPVASLMMGRLRLSRGSLFALARYAGAAKELVAAVGHVEATFPGE